MGEKKMDAWEDHRSWVSGMRVAHSEKRIPFEGEEWKEEPVYRGAEQEEEFEERWKESLPPLVQRQNGRVFH